MLPRNEPDRINIQDELTPRILSIGWATIASIDHNGRIVS